MPPWIWPLTSSGLIMVPTSSTTVSPPARPRRSPGRPRPRRCGSHWEGASPPSQRAPPRPSSTPSGSARGDVLPSPPLEPTPRRCPRRVKLAIVEYDVILGRFQHVRRCCLPLAITFSGRADQSAARRHHRARAEGAGADARPVGIADWSRTRSGGDAERVGDDLAERRLMTLTVVVTAEQEVAVPPESKRISAPSSSGLRSGRRRSRSHWRCRCRAACRAPRTARGAPRSRPSRRPHGQSPGSREVAAVVGVVEPGLERHLPPAGSCCGGGSRRGRGPACRRRGRPASPSHRIASGRPAPR